MVVALVLVGGLLAGCGKSPLLKGNEAFLDGDYAAAEAQWRSLADGGHVHAQHNLGVLEAHLGNVEAAESWWLRAVARDFVPSMLELGELRLAAGDVDGAEALYRRAARWGNSEGAAVLEALGKPIPREDLSLARLRHLDARQDRIARELDRPHPNEYLNRVLDEQLARAEKD